jgi:predicted RNA binding protein YcfA (HicA-like mRNA interferase family)
MPHFGPIKRRELIACFRQLGFTGPYAGGKHEFMQKGDVSVTIPNPHRSDIRPNLLARLLRQAGIERSQWEQI